MSSEGRGSICLEHIQALIRYPNTKILQFKEYIRVYQGNLFARIKPDLIDKVKQKLPESPSKKDVLKVLKSDSELKDFSNAIHDICYKITGNSPVDFRHDECNFLFETRRLLKFYYENKPKRNNFNFRYVLYYLLKRKITRWLSKIFQRLEVLALLRNFVTTFSQEIVHKNSCSKHS